jgi:hypothetical protein
VAEAYQKLRGLGILEKNVIVLTPERSERALADVPEEDAEQPGMGKAIGGVVGGAIGLAAGAAVATLLMPGIGTVLAIGLGAGPLGVGGAVIGAASGGALENLLTRGLPRDEIYLYEDALRQGHTVVIVLDDDDDRLDRARKIMEESGAESLDAARERWWTGLRSADEEHYVEPDDADNEQRYRRGFEAAMDPDFRGKLFEDAASKLRQRYPDLYDDEWFQRGYRRAQDYYSGLQQPGELG